MIKTKDAGFIVYDELLRSCFLVALAAVRDLFTCAKHLFVAAMANGDAAPCQPAICGAGATVGGGHELTEGISPGQGLGGEPGQGQVGRAD